MQIHCKYDILADVKDILKNPKNSNSHTIEQIERLAKILKYQGIRKPLIVSKLSGYLITGHATLEACKMNGWDKVPVSLQDFESEDQELAHLTADNAIQAWSELDLAQINNDIVDMGPDFDIDLLGLESFTVDVNEKDLKDKKEIKLECPDCGFIGDSKQFKKVK